jgi:hypothetical protein
MPIFSCKARSGGAKLGIVLLALLTGACDLFTGSSTDDELSSNIDPDGYSVHVNPGDPVLASAPDGEGGIVQLIGEKSADGRAVQVRSIRRFSASAPGSYDQASFDQAGFPAEVRTRDGAQIYFSYPGDGRVVMTVAMPEGSIESVVFNWYDYGSGASQSRVVFQSSSAQTARLRVSVREDVPERTPVEDAQVDGIWEAASDRYSHLPFVARHAGNGNYEASVPVGPANLGDTEISEICELIPEVVNEGCEVLKRGGASRDFWRLATLSCAYLRIPQAVTACVVGVAVIQFGCIALPPCESATEFVDKYLRVNERVVVRGQVRSGDFQKTFSSTIPSPFTSVAAVEVLVPPRGWGGRWVGSWRGTSAGASPGPGPLVITMKQTGTSVSGSYDLSYGVANFTGSVAAGTLVVTYPFGNGSQARITLTRNGNSLSGSHVDTYPDRVLTFALGLARSTSSSSANPALLSGAGPRGGARPGAPDLR